MDIKADIKWIQQELNKVTDPSLIQSLMDLIKSKKDSIVEVPTKVDYQEIDKRRIAHLKGKSKSFTWEEVKENARTA